MKPVLGRPLALRAREIRTRGRESLEPLPTPEELAAQSEDDRHKVLEGLRVELYAISSLIAHETVARARAARSSYPPYGLVRSMYSEWRLVVESPEPVKEGLIDSFYSLGKAYVDTLVFHLQRQFKEQRKADEGWLLERLEELLALFRLAAGPVGRSRMRDALSFIYGGLHFGTGVSVQLTEVMSRMLQEFPDMTTREKARVIARSSRPAYRLASINVDHVVAAYQKLQQKLTTLPTAGAGGSGWMDASWFLVQHVRGRPWKIDFRDEEAITKHDIPTTYETQGCPARTPPAGGASAIATLWSWCAQLAHGLELLGPPEHELEDSELGAERLT